MRKTLIAAFIAATIARNASRANGSTRHFEYPNFWHYAPWGEILR